MVDAPVDAARLTPPGVWLSVSDLAQAKGISKQAVAKRVSKFEALGEQITRPGDRGTKLVNLAAYDRLVGDTGDIFRAQTPAPKTAAAMAADDADADPARSSLATEQARRVSYQAELARLDLEERLGKLVPVSDVVDAMTKVGRAIVRAVDLLPSHADELAASVAKDGSTGARRVLKGMARELRTTLEREMRLFEKGAPRDGKGTDDAEEAEP